MTIAKVATLSAKYAVLRAVDRAVDVGVALLFAGIGFLVLTIYVLRPALSPAKTARGTAPTAIPA